MYTSDQDIFKAYLQAKQQTNEIYKKAPEYGTLVEDRQGNRYIVLEASPDVKALEKYDDGNIASEFASKLDANTLDNTLWLAVSDPVTKKVGVFIFGKEGLDVVVQNANMSQNDTRDVINALKQVVSDEGGAEKNIPLNPEQKEEKEEEEEGEFKINVENVSEEIDKQLELENLIESVRSGRIETPSDLMDYAIAISRRAFGGQMNMEKVKEGYDQAMKLYKNAGKNWIPAIGFLKKYFACFRPGTPEAAAYGPFIKQQIAKKQEMRKIIANNKLKKTEKKSEKQTSTKKERSKQAKQAKTQKFKKYEKFSEKKKQKAKEAASKKLSLKKSKKKITNAKINPKRKTKTGR